MAGNVGGYVSSPVTTPVAAGAVVSGDIAPGTVTSGVPSSGSVTGQAGGGFFVIASGTIATFDIGSGAIVSGRIASGVVGNFHIGSGLVQGLGGAGVPNIASGTFNGFELGSGSIISGRVASGQIGFGHQANASTQSGTIASGQVSNFHLASGVIPAVNSIYGDAIATRTVTGQTATNSGLLVTVSGTGMYLFSAYLEVPQGGLLNAGNGSVQLGWTDSQQAQSGTVVGSVALLTSGDYGQGSAVIRCQSGTNVIMSVILSSVTGAPVYNAYGALQRIF